MNQVVVLLPGGFKPPHIGHLGLANKFASRTDVSKVLVMVGPSERDGIGLQQSLSIWNLLSKHPKVQVLPVEDDSPMNAAFGYVFNLPKNSKETIALGASAKSPEDAKRSKIFAAAVERYKTKPTKEGATAPKGITVVDMTDDVPAIYNGRSDDKNGQSISASTLRKDLAEKNFNNFKTNYPGVNDSTVKQIYKILTNMNIKERVDNLPKEKKELLKNLVNEKIKSLKRELMNAKIKAKVKEYVTGEDETSSPPPPAIDVSFTEEKHKKANKIQDIESRLNKLEKAIKVLKIK